MDSDISNCIQESSCAHSMDAGVKCLPFTDACAVPVNQVVTTVETTTACNCQQPIQHHQRLHSVPHLVQGEMTMALRCLYNQQATNHKYRNFTTNNIAVPVTEIITNNTKQSLSTETSTTKEWSYHRVQYHLEHSHEY